MTTVIKPKLKKSDDQTNIDKFRVVVNITEFHIIQNQSSFVQMAFDIYNSMVASHNYFYKVTAKGIIPEILRSIGQF